MSCIYGQRQMGTEDQGWVAHFLIRILPASRSPSSAMAPGPRHAACRRRRRGLCAAPGERIDQVSGSAFNLGGGPATRSACGSLIAVSRTCDRPGIEVRFEDWRAGDQRYFVADARAAREALGLAEPIRWRSGVAGLADWLQGEQGPGRRTVAA
jgi:CDP-paratose 2-epimerase